MRVSSTIHTTRGSLPSFSVKWNGTSTGWPETVIVLSCGVSLPSSGGRLPPPPSFGGTTIEPPVPPPTPKTPPPASVVPPPPPWPLSPPAPEPARRSELEEQDKTKSAMAAANPIQRMSISAQATACPRRAREASAGTRPGNDEFTKRKLGRKDKGENQP
jgi:hypothetical protein